MTEEAGKRAIEKALLYSKHEWYASEKNVMHGIDKNGRYVDTPDVTWRGEEFDCGWWKPGQLNVLSYNPQRIRLRPRSMLLHKNDFFGNGFFTAGHVIGSGLLVLFLFKVFEYEHFIFFD